MVFNVPSFIGNANVVVKLVPCPCAMTVPLTDGLPYWEPELPLKRGVVWKPKTWFEKLIF